MCCRKNFSNKEWLKHGTYFYLQESDMIYKRFMLIVTVFKLLVNSTLGYYGGL